VDIIHHACIGGAGFVVLAAQDQELAGLGFLAGSVFPDLDVLFIAAGKRFYLKHHQGLTHSLPMALLYAVLFASIPALQPGWSWSLYMGLLAGLGVHILLDLCNTFGIQIFWPLSPKRFCLDAVFFIDTVLWGLTAGFFALVLTGTVSAGRAAIAYATLFSSYVFAKLILQRRTKKRLGVDFAIPSALNPFGFFLFTQRGWQLRTARFNALTGLMAQECVLPDTALEVAGLTGQSSVYRDMQSILRSLHVIRTDVCPSGTTVVAEDLVVRNFGGRFGRTELRFDAQGRLIHEMANI
jgi:membrane-bound metal-dependent hydrolase YbcI (DUF457 family)